MTKQQAIVWLQKAIERDYCLIELPYNLVAGVIELLAKVPEWVSVKDMPPKGHNPVLVYSMEAGITIACYTTSGKWLGNDGYYVNEVTYWEPLPNQPEDA